jgi:hypothetical protein
MFPAVQQGVLPSQLAPLAMHVGVHTPALHAEFVWQQTCGPPAWQVSPLFRHTRPPQKPELHTAPEQQAAVPSQGAPSGKQLGPPASTTASWPASTPTPAPQGPRPWAASLAQCKRRGFRRKRRLQQASAREFWLRRSVVSSSGGAPRDPPQPAEQEIATTNAITPCPTNATRSRPPNLRIPNESIGGPSFVNRGRFGRAILGATIVRAAP